MKFLRIKLSAGGMIRSWARGRREYLEVLIGEAIHVTHAHYTPGSGPALAQMAPQAKHTFGALWSSLHGPPHVTTQWWTLHSTELFNYYYYYYY